MKKNTNLIANKWLLATVFTLGFSSVVQAQFPSPFNLADIDGSNGFVINGEFADDNSGGAASSAGDINGDGINDILIGASTADPNGSFSGRSYVIFGSTAGFPSLLNLTDIDGVNGFVINGEAHGDFSGAAVSAAGDVNADGIDDILVGANRADPNGNSSGRAYVIFGTTSGFANPFNLTDIDGVNGFIINGESAGDGFGVAVSTAGDINADGIDDILIGATGVDVNGNEDAGRAYIIFGSAASFTSPFELTSLDGSNGFVLNGENADDISGDVVSPAGDINGDGIADILVAATDADSNGNSNTGRTYVVFGSNSSFASSFDLADIDGTNGFIINGENTNDQSGAALTLAGDINADGIDDILIGARGASPNNMLSAGRSYVIFGSTTGLPNPLNLTDIDGTNGFVINGENSGDRSGVVVGSAGDINSDGIADIAIGAHSADPNGNASGRSYIIYGNNSGFANSISLADIDGVNGFVLDGENAGDRFGSAIATVGDVNGDDLGDVLIGAFFASPSASTDAAGKSYMIFGKSEHIFENGFED